VNKEGYLNSACFLRDDSNNLFIITSNFYYISSESIKVYDLDGKKIKEMNKSNEKVIFMESYYDDNYSKSYIIISTHEYVKSYDYNNNALYHKYNNNIKRLHFSLIIKKHEEVIKLIESCYDDNLRIWNFHSGELLQKIKVGVGGLQSICFFNNGDLIVSNNKKIKMVNLTNRFITDLIKTDKNIVSVKIVYFQNEEYIIFQGQENNPINIYNIKAS
jgi:WD40 repeat protein